jgi:CRP/FNR family cyclic AMP-dependent transcriptional regulator
VTIKDILAAGTLRRFDSKQTILSQGAPGDSIHLLLSGGVKVSLTARDGKETILDILSEGDFFGEMSLFGKQPRSASLITLVPSVTLQIDHAAFVEMLSIYPNMSINLIAVLMSRLRMMDGLLSDLLSLDAEERIAKRIVALSKIYGTSSAGGGLRITLKMSQQDIASMVGLSRESVNKCLRAWEESGLIATDSGFLTLKYPDRLGAMAS